MSDERSIVKVATPFRDSLASTLGAGVGVALLVGLPALIVGGVVVFVGWRAWRSYREWSQSRTTRTAEIGVREVSTSIGSSEDLAGSVASVGASTQSLPAPRARRSAQKRKSAPRTTQTITGRIVQ